jgi:hypothetical protein
MFSNLYEQAKRPVLHRGILKYKLCIGEITEVTSIHPSMKCRFEIVFAVAMIKLLEENYALIFTFEL